MDLALPPEVSSTQIYAGPGVGSLGAAASAWAGLAAQLEQFTADHAATVSVVNGVWLGPSDAAMSAVSSRVVSWAQSTSAQAAQMGAAATQAVSAFEAVHAAVTPPVEVFANRARLVVLVATNLLGQNTAAIAATETEYGQMWAQNIAAMSMYQVSSAQSTSTLTAFKPLSGLFNIFLPGSNQDTTGLAGLLNLFSGSSGSSFGSLLNSNIFSTGFLNSAAASGTPSNWLGPFAGFLLGDEAASAGRGTGTTGTPQGETPAEYNPPPPNYNYPGKPAAETGSGRAVGGLTVPPGWATQARQTSDASPPLRLTSAVTAPLESTPNVAAPMPLGGLRGGTPPKVSKPPPEYGVVSAVMRKNPFGG